MGSSKTIIWAELNIQFQVHFFGLLLWNGPSIQMTYSSAESKRLHPYGFWIGRKSKYTANLEPV